MDSVERDGVRLAYVEDGPARPDGVPLLLVHGWTGDHGTFAPQLAHLRQRRRVVAVDLRGHGGSDAPRQSYGVKGFAEDVAFVAERLGLREAVLVGHSMGGLVGLEVAAGRPGLLSGLVMIDSPLLPPAELVDAIRPVALSLGGDGHGGIMRALAAQLFIGSDDAARREGIIDGMAAVAPHVAVSALVGHFLEYDAGPALDACAVPLAYLAAGGAALSDLARVQARRPDLLLARTLGSGHFSTVEVPGQINAMLDRFLELLPVLASVSGG
ncbi:MAG: alpha/beta fold hydrolase [Janthinobacterium lividum]